MIKVTRLELGEMLAKLPHLNSRKEKAEYLQQHDSKVLQWFIESCFDVNVKYDIEVPEYRPSIFPRSCNYSRIDLELKMLLELRNPQSKLKAERKALILARILESVHAEEAELVAQAVSGKCKVPGLTKAVVEAAFPGIETKKAK